MVTPDVGGHLALDFANTIEPSREHLATGQDLKDWAARHGLEGTGGTLERARELRRAIYEVFRPIADGTEPSAGALARLQEFHAQAVATGQLTPAGFTWADDALAPVAVAAVDLLRSGPLDRVSTCAACPWLFLDTSRNHSRRWCSMDDCGARAKMRRYRAKA